MKKNPPRASPCCNARSHLRKLSLETKEVVFRCSACGQLRIERLGAQTKQAAAPGRHLRLVVSR